MYESGFGGGDREGEARNPRTRNFCRGFEVGSSEMTRTGRLFDFEEGRRVVGEPRKGVCTRAHKPSWILFPNFSPALKSHTLR